MKKSIFYIIILLALVGFVATSCSRSFKIEGRVENLGSQNVHMVWATAEGVKEVRSVASNNYFEFEGMSPAPALVLIYDAQNRMLAHFVMEDGDHMQLRGDATDLLGIEVKGEDVNERWYQFIQQHRSEYQDASRSSLDAAIEKYVKENPSDLLSTLLLVADFSQLNNQQKMKQLLGGIEADAKPEWLLKAYQRLVERRPKSSSKIGSMLLMEDTGDFASINTTTSRSTLLYLWVNSTAHNGEMATLKQLSEEIGDTDRLQICDIYIDADTASWRGYTRNDGSTWRHFWAPEGPLNPQLRSLSIASTPLYVVTDSLGNVKYNGPDANAATNTARHLAK
ncbi:MAG: hypothetical protein Q4B68_05185 [Bacteroidales bacterium]|nr:hypothetical protein [Bacteroidales bacterium]